MTSEQSPEPDPRRKRALYIGGAIALAAVAWNYDGWGGDPVEVTVVGDREDIREAADAIRDAVRDEVRDEVRGGFRGDGEPDGDTPSETEDNAETAEASAGEAGENADGPSDEVIAETRDGNRRIVETASGENQRTFRIENDDGRGVTISVDSGEN